MINMSQVVLYKPLDFYDFYGDDTGCAPFGLMALSSSLRRKGITSVIIDAKIESLNLIDFDILLFGVTCMTKTDMFDALEAAHKIKKLYDTPIIFGGFYPTFNPVEVLSNEDVDMVCVGMGEETIVELTDVILNNKLDLSRIDGLVYKRDGEIIFNSRRKCESLFNFSSADYSGVDLGRYIRPFPSDDDRGIAYFASRGCPYSCSFCSVRTFYDDKYYPYSMDRVIEDLENYVNNYHINGIYFWDDNFFVDKERVLRLCNLLIDKQLKLKWGALARSSSINQYSDEEWRVVVKSGCVYLNIGMQSGSDRMLTIYDRKETVKDYKLAIERCKQFNIGLLVDFIIGHPNETQEDLLLTFDLIDDLWTVDNFYVIIYNYTVYPSVPNIDNFMTSKIGMMSDVSVVNLIITLLSVDRLSRNSSIVLKHPTPRFPKRNGIIRFVKRLIFLDAKWRWKNRFFCWNVELKMILLLRIINIIYHLFIADLLSLNFSAISRKWRRLCQTGLE